VTEILNKEYDDVNIHKLRQKLHDIPGNLHELFREILTRDGHNSGELFLCVQWLLFARQPLKPEQLYFAILSGVNPEALSEFDSGEITTAVMERFILSSSKGLVEITKSKSPTVQFIHESVRDFLLKENGLMEIWSDLGGNFEAASHDQLKQCCLTYMHINTAIALKIAGSLPTENIERVAKLRQLADKKFPFLEYATKNVLYHANAAEAGGISQASFLQSFQRSDWIKLNNLFEHHGVRRHTKGARPLSLSERIHFNLSERHWVRRNTANTSLLYILSERDMAALIEALPSNRSFFEEEDERYGTPLFAAFATGSHGAVESFAQLCSEMHPQSSLHRECYNQFLKNRTKTLKREPTFTFSREEGALSHIVAHQEDTLFAFFILLGRAYTDDLRGQALSYAAKRGHEVIVRLLLEAGHVDLDSKRGGNRTPLSWAAGLGYEGIVQLLLETDQVKVDSQCRY
jgi:ankyrin repeat protein